MIFMSHTSSDKPIVEPIACKMAEVFGRERVFYDSWSIQPGDGIIQKMSEGLSECRFFFLFVSKRSLESAMVGLEWYTAVMKAVNGGMRFIPIRLDNCALPPILEQTCYLDLFSNGMGAVIRQMVDIIHGDNTFRANSASFRNLKAYVNRVSSGECHIEIRAERYMEPVSRYAIALVGGNAEVCCTSEVIVRQDHREVFTTEDGRNANIHLIATERATSPGFPVKVKLVSEKGRKIGSISVLHAQSEAHYEAIPMVDDRSVIC